MAAPTALHLARRAVRPSLPACRAAVRRPSPAAFTLSARAAEKEAGARTDRYPDDDHMLRKRDALDVQGANAKAGLECVLSVLRFPSAAGRCFAALPPCARSADVAKGHTTGQTATRLAATPPSAATLLAQ